MPMREIRQKYTQSDLVLLSWDSRQKSYNMSKSFPSRKSSKDSNSDDDIVTHNVKEDSEFYHLPSGVNNGVPVKKKWFNKEGDLDLRLATGREAANYLRALGVKLMSFD